MKKNKIILSIILASLLSTNTTLNANFIYHANVAAAARASRNREQYIEYPIYEGKIVDIIEMRKTSGNDYFVYLIDRDGNENTIEDIMKLYRDSKYLIVDQLKKGSQLKYIDPSYGKDKIYFDNILEIDGEKPNRKIKNYIMREGKMVKIVKIKTNYGYLFKFLIDRDGNENTIENVIEMGTTKNDLPNYPIINQLKGAKQIKYRDYSFGEKMDIKLNDVVEIDGRNLIIKDIFNYKQKIN